MSSHQRPTEHNAREVAARYLGHERFTLSRYPTGMCHYVYEVTPDSGPKVVVRMGHEDTRQHLEGSVFWDEQLKPLKLPTARILYHDLSAEFPYMLLEHLAGTDLGERYASLTPGVRREIARAIADSQTRVGGLPQARGYGYGYSYSDPRLTASWRSVLNEQLDRSRTWMRQAGVVEESHVDRVAEALSAISLYLDEVAPTPFLHDTTTKNVLVNERGLVGIVDIDDICFGDRLYVVSLTNMALISLRVDTDYIDVWCDEWSLSPIQRKAMRLYTAIHCVGFMSEIGHRFNKDVVEIDHGRLRYLEGILNLLLES